MSSAGELCNIQTIKLIFNFLFTLLLVNVGIIFCYLSHVNSWLTFARFTFVTLRLTLHPNLLMIIFSLSRLASGKLRQDWMRFVMHVKIYSRPSATNSNGHIGWKHILHCWRRWVSALLPASSTLSTVWSELHSYISLGLVMMVGDWSSLCWLQLAYSKLPMSSSTDLDRILEQNSLPLNVESPGSAVTSLTITLDVLRPYGVRHLKSQGHDFWYSFT